MYCRVIIIHHNPNVSYASCISRILSYLLVLLNEVHIKLSQQLCADHMPTIHWFDDDLFIFACDYVIRSQMSVTGPLLPVEVNNNTQLYKLTNRKKSWFSEITAGNNNKCFLLSK